MCLVPRISLAACPPSGDVDISQIATQATSISFDAYNRGKTITAFGTLKNNSSMCLQEISFEVKYFDSKGAQVDVSTQTLAVTIGPGQETAFRVRDDASKEQEAYATSTIRVIAVQPLFGRVVKNASSLWTDLLYGLAPPIVMVIFLLFFFRRMTGKNSLQRQSLALVQRQQESLERIAVALERRLEA